jgi:hypothetical protein
MLTQTPMLVDDLRDFIEQHRACGTFTGDATHPAERGYVLRVECPCGAVFREVGQTGGRRVRSRVLRSAGDAELRRTPYSTKKPSGFP